MILSSGANCFELVTYTSHLTFPKNLLHSMYRVRPQDAEVILVQFFMWVDENAVLTDSKGKVQTQE